MTEKKPGIELKPCPFCGGVAQILTSRISCHSCSATGPQFESGKTIQYTPIRLISAWNHRYTDDQHAKELEEAFEAARMCHFNSERTEHTCRDADEHGYYLEWAYPTFEDYQNQKKEGE